MMKKILLILILFTTFNIGCKKGWLDEKPDKSLIVPSTLEDLQALLDNSAAMNHLLALGEIAVDDYYIPDDLIGSLFQAVEINGYSWKKDDLYQGEDLGDWKGQYNKILTANVVLETIQKIERTGANQASWDNIKGSALFYRAYALHGLVQTFAKPFNETTAGTDLGVPIKLSSDVSEQSTRENIAKVYQQIKADLSEAALLLPSVPSVKTRPSKCSTYAVLSRAFLDMADFEAALDNANKSLESYNKLIDYNTIDLNATTTFARFNDEVILDGFMDTYSFMSNSYHFVDTTFFKDFAANDLRKSAFFTASGPKNYVFKGSYGGPAGLAGILWGGIATDEVYFIKAECLARANKIGESMQVLNFILSKRYQNTSFIPFTASDRKSAISIVLKERRKELPFRGIRFNDLRRLNKEADFAVTISRKINGVLYQLPPNDLRYTYPIPDKIIRMTGMQQNVR